MIMFLLLICFFFLPATACDELEGKRKLYVNPLENMIASGVNITPGKRYRLFFENGKIEYRAEFNGDNRKCLLLIHGDSFDFEQPLAANWSVPIIKGAWLSHITLVLRDRDSDIASKILNINNNPKDFKMSLGEGFQLQAVMCQGRKQCHLWTPKDEWFYLDGEKLYDSVKQRFIGKEGLGKDLFAVLGSG